jgi:hypothetical protein
MGATTHKLDEIKAQMKKWEVSPLAITDKTRAMSSTASQLVANPQQHL